MMRAWPVVCVACVACVLGCASGRPTGEAADAAPGSPDAKVWHDGSVVVTPDAHQVVTPDAHQVGCHTQELLANPVLDMNPSGMGWVQVNIDDAYPIITSDGFTSDSAPYKAWMGGMEGYDYGVYSLTDVLYQDITIPTNTTTLKLTGKYAVGTNETDAGTYDTGEIGLVQTNATPVETALSLTNESGTAGWTAIDHTFAAPHAGETLRLRMTSTNDVMYATNFFFDTLSLSATVCN